jgi:hypothetical protein
MDRGACYVSGVTEPLKAHVRNGRLVLDEPTDLPEGTEVELVVADSWDDLDDDDREMAAPGAGTFGRGCRSGSGAAGRRRPERLRPAK